MCARERESIALWWWNYFRSLFHESTLSMWTNHMHECQLHSFIASYSIIIVISFQGMCVLYWLTRSCASHWIKQRNQSTHANWNFCGKVLKVVCVQSIIRSPLWQTVAKNIFYHWKYYPKQCVTKTTATNGEQAWKISTQWHKTVYSTLIQPSYNFCKSKNYECCLTV